MTIFSTPDTPGTKLAMLDLESADSRPREVVDNLDDQWSVTGNVGTEFFLMTNRIAPRFKVVTRWTSPPPTRLSPM